ncbi:MAG: hypothetical protein JXR91_15465 [Deltaproteobacteria bacterium]|nr:hypothetical protein [Deltaproteobacteria bacterium]
MTKVHLFIRWRIPLIYRTRVKSTATYEIEEGVTLGVRSSEWIQKSPPVAASFVTAGVDLSLGNAIRLEFYAVLNGAFSRTDLISSPVLPGGGLYWTF